MARSVGRMQQFGAGGRIVGLLGATDRTTGHTKAGAPLHPLSVEPVR